MKFLVGVAIGIMIGRATVEVTPDGRAEIIKAIDAVAWRLNRYSEKLAKENKK